MLGWLTPDSPPADFLCRRLLIPNNEAWLAIVSGCLLALTKEKNFESYGTATPEDTAAKFAIMFDQFSLTGYCHMIGEIIIWPSGLTNPPGFGNPPTGDILRCNGAYVNISDYPDLYAVVGTEWGPLVGSTFRIPGTADGFIRDASGAGQVGIVGGQNNVTLSVANLPAHTHTEITAIAAVGAAITGVPVPSAIPGIGATGSVGSGTPFDNRPQFVTMRNYVQAR